jgi:hypothetical protein
MRGGNLHRCEREDTFILSRSIGKALGIRKAAAEQAAAARAFSATIRCVFTEVKNCNQLVENQ